MNIFIFFIIGKLSASDKPLVEVKSEFSQTPIILFANSSSQIESSRKEKSTQTDRRYYYEEPSVKTTTFYFDPESLEKRV